MVNNVLLPIKIDYYSLILLLIAGDVYSKIRLKRIIKIRLHPECSVFDKGNELFLIYDFNQLMPLIDGESILHLYDFHRSVINEFLEMLENDNCS